jgi:hypothetical protein
MQMNKKIINLLTLVENKVIKKIEYLYFRKINWLVKDLKEVLEDNRGLYFKMKKLLYEMVRIM